MEGKQHIVKKSTSFEDDGITSLQNRLAKTSSKVVRLPILKEIIEQLIANYKSNAAIPYADSYINIAAQINNNIEISRGNLLKGKLLLFNYKPDEALKLLNESLRFCEVNSEEQLNTLFYIAEVYFYKCQYPLALSRSEQLLDLISEKEVGNLEIRIKIQLALIHQKLGNSKEAMQYAEDALSLSEKNKDHLNTLKSIRTIGRTYGILGKVGDALPWFWKGLEIANKEKDKFFQAAMYNDIGQGQILSRNYKEALVSFTKALSIANKENFLLLKMVCYKGVGTIHLRTGNLKDALQNLVKGLKIAEETGPKTEFAGILMNIGNVYLEQKNINRALEYYFSTIEVAEMIGHSLLIYHAYNNIANVSNMQKKYDNALFYLDKALLIGEKISKEIVKTNWGNRGACLCKQGKYKEGIECFEKVITMCNGKELQDKGHSLNNIAGAFLLSGDFKLAQEKAEKALQIGKDIGVDKLMQDAHRVLYEVEKKDGNFEKALYHCEMYSEMDARSRESKKAKSINNLELQLEMYRNNQTVSNLKKQIQDININTNEELVKITSVASHDLRTPLNHILSFAAIVKQSNLTKLPKEDIEALEIIEQSATKMLNLLGRIMHYAIAGTAVNTGQLTNLNGAVAMAIKNKDEQIKQTQAVIKVANLPSVAIPFKEAVEVLTQLLDNALKFQPPNQIPIINIEAKRFLHEYQIEVKDNGIGIDLKAVRKVFEIFSRLHKEGEYEGLGIGLATCKKIITNYGGQIWVSSEPDKGASFYFTIPHTHSKDEEHGEELYNRLVTL